MMELSRIDRWARQVAARATTRRGLARLGVGGVVAGLGLGVDEARAVCRAPKKGCKKGTQCCSGKCKKGKCLKCASGTSFCAKACVDTQSSTDHCGACGTACVAGQRCEHGICTCGGGSCTGCCDGTTCQPGTSSGACGVNGGACLSCANGQACEAGGCVCTPTSCATGCCDGTICQPGTSDAFCGTAGGACQTCPYDKTCANGVCVDRTCPGGHCRAFVTSTTYDGNLGGVVGADAACQERAAAATLPGTYMAWISDATVTPLTRFPTKSPEPYRLVDNTQLAVNWAALTDGNLDAAPNLTELGTVPGNPIFCFTNTLADGNAGGMVEDGHCQNWTAASGNGNLGRVTETNLLWSSASGGELCAGTQRLYCFQQS